METHRIFSGQTEGKIFDKILERFKSSESALNKAEENFPV
jgi:hypothetical protein